MRVMRSLGLYLLVGFGLLVISMGVQSVRGIEPASSHVASPHPSGTSPEEPVTTPTPTPVGTPFETLGPSPTETPEPSPTATPDPELSTDGVVQRSGSQLTLDGGPYTFRGLNVYNANSHGWCAGAMNIGTALDEALAAQGERKNVIRAWFFQPMAQPTPDNPVQERTWDAFDHTLSVADAHGMKVIVTLTDQWGECGDGGINEFKTQEWYQTGYQEVQPGMLVSYRDYVQEVVARYRGDPRIAFWQLINEAEAAPALGQCPGGPEQAAILKSWAADMSALVKSIDPVHLVSLGSIGGGQCGMQDDQYLDVHDLPDIDLCEYHDYSPTEPMPGDQWNGLQVRLDQCATLNKPLFVGEVGIIPNQVGGTLQDRAAALLAKLEVQSVAGVQGFVAWAWMEGTDNPAASYDIGPGDPLLDVLMVNTPPWGYPSRHNTALTGVATDVYPHEDAEDDDGDRIFIRSLGQPLHGTTECSAGRCTYTSEPGYVGPDAFTYTLADGKGGTAVADVSIEVVEAGDVPYVRVSETADGRSANDGSTYASVSADGRYVAFTSPASNLVPGDTNNRQDVFLYDVQQDTIERISVAADGSQGNNGSFRARISADGRVVAFESSATNLVPGDTNGEVDVFVRDIDAGTTERVSVASNGDQSNAWNAEASVSSDGRFVAFNTSATNLVPNGSQGGTKAYLRDRLLGTTTLVSVRANGSPAQGMTPSVSGDGRYVAFGSDERLVNDTNSRRDVYVRDMALGTTTLVSVGPDGVNAPTGGVGGAHLYGGRSMSADGRLIVFYAEVRLIADDQPGGTDVYVRDVASGTTTRLTAPVSGPNRLSYGPSIASDGSYAVFQSEATNLVPDDDNDASDIFRRALDPMGELERITLSPVPAELQGSYFPTVSDGGRVIVWHSDSPNLVPGDANGAWDIFLWHARSTDPDPDADGDGVVDSIAGPTPGSFDDGAGTSGSIIDAAGHEVLVAPDVDGVRITVEGAGTDKATFNVCGFTLRLAPGSEVVISCGSISVTVVEGAAEIVLGDGLVVVSVPLGVTAIVDEQPDGGYTVEHVAGDGDITVTVDGISATVVPGQPALTFRTWQFVGFEAPVDNDGVLNQVKAGLAVPLKWRLLDAAGAPVTDLAGASVSVASLSCSTGTSADQLEEPATGRSGLHNLGDGYYQFNWKTPKGYANSCKTLRLDIGDGVLHTAMFQFKK